MLKKVSRNFQDQNPIIPYGEIMNSNFGAFMRLIRSEPAPLGVCLMAGILMAGLSGCGPTPTQSSSSNSGVNSTPQQTHGNHEATSPARRLPAHFTNADDAKPFPAVLDPKQFSEPAVFKAYSYARNLPEVFSQQPCYCNCDLGVAKDENPHRSLLDCFASYHGAS